MKLEAKRAQNKLLKSGYLPQKQTDSFELWLDVMHGGTNISFYKSDECESIDCFKVHGVSPDRPEFDEVNSFYTESLSSAIRVSRAKFNK